MGYKARLPTFLVPRFEETPHHSEDSRLAPSKNRRELKHHLARHLLETNFQSCVFVQIRNAIYDARFGLAKWIMKEYLYYSSNIIRGFARIGCIPGLQWLYDIRKLADYIEMVIVATMKYNHWDVLAWIHKVYGHDTLIENHLMFALTESSYAFHAAMKVFQLGESYVRANLRLIKRCVLLNTLEGKIDGALLKYIDSIHPFQLTDLPAYFINRSSSRAGIHVVLKMLRHRIPPAEEMERLAGWEHESIMVLKEEMRCLGIGNR